MQQEVIEPRQAIKATQNDRDRDGRRELVASVAYALWDSRRDRNAPDDPEADWFNAEELVEDLESFNGA